MATAIEATADDVFVSWLPLYHDMGLIGAWLGGFTVEFRLVRDVAAGLSRTAVALVGDDFAPRWHAVGRPQLRVRTVA